MKYWLHSEELLKLAASYWLTLYFDYAGWLFFAWLLAPDLSMVGYLVNTKVGAVLYNLAHHQGLAVAIAVCGVVFSVPHLVFTGSLLFGHSAMDRIFGYGLKYTDDFKHTHLGWIGKK
jgi:hypothetical protein